MNKLVKIRDEGIEILDSELAKKIKSTKLSASMVSSILHCPADWIFNSFLMSYVEHTEKIFFARGRLFHSVMENFFTLEGKERQKELLKDICKKEFENDFVKYNYDLETQHWLIEAVKSFLEMTELDWKNIKVATVTNNKEKTKGLECKVSGNIGKAKRPVTGFVDMCIEHQNGIKVVDWKTGKRINPFDINKPISDKNSFEYWRQQLIYSQLLSNQNNVVTGAALWFPCAKGIVEVEINNPIAVNRMIEDVELADNNLTKYMKNNLFPFHNALFCSFCSFYSTTYRGKPWQMDVNVNQLNTLLER